jgi:lipopolysaccharide biosynthesis glycosyltransferase
LSDADPIVVCASDDGYALPLAVAIHSAARHLDPGRRLRVFLLDAGLSPPVERRLRRAWRDAPLDLEIVRPDLAAIRALAVPAYPSAGVYLRLLTPELLPEDVERAIYLDSDVVVCADLARLWESDLGGRPLGAIQDASIPFFDAERALPDLEAVREILWSVRGVANWEELGLDPCSPYLNSGVLLMDLAAWRREASARRLLDCLREQRAHAGMPDQYVLNVVFAGRWQALDLRWNAPPALFAHRAPGGSPFDAATLSRARAEPWIVHYVGALKPWSWDGHVAWRERFQTELAQTPWPVWARGRWTLRPWLWRRWRRYSRPWRRAAGRLGKTLGRLPRSARGRAAALLRRGS